MKKLTNKEASLIKGSGCRKYLRRYHRAIKNDDQLEAFVNFMEYNLCITNY